MLNIYTFLDNEISKVTEKINIQVTPSLIIKYILEFEILNSKLKNSDYNMFFIGNDFDIWCGGNEITSKDILIELLEQLDTSTVMKFKIQKKFSFNEKVELYSDMGQKNFLDNILKLKTEKFADLTKKIHVTSFKQGSYYSKPQVTSSLFEFTSSPVSLELNEAIINHLLKNKNSSNPILLVPNILDEMTLLRTNIYPIINQLLEIIANDSHGNKYYFKGKFNLIINSNESIEYTKMQLKSHFFSLLKIINYINSQEVTSDQKKTFLRKSLCDNIIQDTEINLDKLDIDFFEDALKDTCFLFDTFEDGEVSVFLKEKKELLKEFFNFTKDINTHISNLQNSIIKLFLVILTAVITHTLFKVKLGVNDSQNILIILSILLFLGLNWIFFEYKEYKNLINLQKQLNILTKNFDFLSSKVDETKKDAEFLVDENLKTLKTIIIFAHIAFAILALLLYMLLVSFIIK